MKMIDKYENELDKLNDYYFDLYREVVRHKENTFSDLTINTLDIIGMMIDYLTLDLPDLQVLLDILNTAYLDDIVERHTYFDEQLTTTKYLSDLCDNWVSFENYIKSIFPIYKDMGIDTIDLTMFRFIYHLYLMLATGSETSESLSHLIMKYSCILSTFLKF